MHARSCAIAHTIGCGHAIATRCEHVISISCNSVITTDVDVKNLACVCAKQRTYNRMSQFDTSMPGSATTYMLGP